jgi:SAM-dependent methyltransferase
VTAGWDARGYDRSFSFVTAYGSAVVDLLNPRPGERILDLGCGTGHLSADIAARGAQVIGVDIDSAMINEAQTAHPALSFRVVDAHDLVSELEPLEPFDAVFSNASMHWMREPQRVIAQIHRVLRSGGRLVAEQGGHRNVEALHAAIRAARADVGLDPEIDAGTDFPTPAQVAIRLESAGFEVRLLELFSRPTRLEPGRTAADWARMFGHALIADAGTDRLVELLNRVDLHAAPTQRDADGWWVDYVRLRYVAVA